MKPDFQESKYSDEKVFLKSRSANPFGEWADWYGTDGEAVVSFFHFKNRLYDVWSRQCISYEHPNCDHDKDGIEGINEKVNCDESVRVTDYENFDYSEVDRPGIYQDSVHYYDEDKVDESYTVIVPEEFLSAKLCGHWLDKLNHEYNRQFVLALNPAQWLHYLRGDDANGSANAVIFKDKINYEKVWEELQDIDADLPRNVVLSIKGSEEQIEKWSEKFLNLYADDKDVKVIHREKV